jgi:hypothetical protein
MKPCKLTFNGSRYMVNAQGVVARQIDLPDALVPGFTDYRFCGLEESESVRIEVKRQQHNKQRRERDQVMRDMGVVKVRGALGGTYWE